MGETRIIYEKQGKGGHTVTVTRSLIKSSNDHCCQCFMTIGHGEKRSQTVIGTVHNDCLHKIIMAAFKKAGLSVPRMSSSPRATLEEAFATLFYDKKPDQKKIDLVNALHQDFFRSPVNIYGILATRKIAREILDTTSAIHPLAHVDLMAKKFQKTFGQPINISKVHLLY